MTVARIRSGNELGGRWAVGAVAGRGGVGVVHRATDLRSGDAALLTVPYARVRTALDPEGGARALAAAAAVQHPGVVPLLDAATGAGEETPYFVTGPVAGRSLAGLILDGALSPRRALAVGAATADALAAVHAAGLVHRTLRPGSIALSPAEHRDPGPAVALLDLGVAELFRTPYFTLYPRLFGTAAYVSPEQVWNVPVGAATDVYALGLVLIEALSGAPAFPGSTAEEAKVRVLGAAPVPTHLPRGVRALLSAMTAVDPADRPPAAEVGERLRSERRDVATATIPIVRPTTSPVPAVLATRPLRLAQDGTVEEVPDEDLPVPLAHGREDAPAGRAAAVADVLGRGRARTGRSVLTARAALVARLRGTPLPPHLGRRVAAGGGGVVVAAGLVLVAALAATGGAGQHAPRVRAAVAADAAPPAAPAEAAHIAPGDLAGAVTGSATTVRAALAPAPAAPVQERSRPAPAPTAVPTSAPTPTPTPTATATPAPSTAAPTSSPAPTPFSTPTEIPTATPTEVPTSTPTEEPTTAPPAPTESAPAPTEVPSATPPVDDGSTPAPSAVGGEQDAGQTTAATPQAAPSVPGG
jgi:hypothetical protein